MVNDLKSIDKSAPENNQPVRLTMCATCPFRPGSKYEYLRADLEFSARTSASRLCHSTGANNAINRRTGFPEHICRGARDVQLEQFYIMGLLSEPTDESWNDNREKFGFPRQPVQDPIKI
jgi:hypothetical protein